MKLKHQFLYKFILGLNAPVSTKTAFISHWKSDIRGLTSNYSSELLICPGLWFLKVNVWRTGPHTFWVSSSPVNVKISTISTAISLRIKQDSLLPTLSFSKHSRTTLILQDTLFETQSNFYSTTLSTEDYIPVLIEKRTLFTSGLNKFSNSQQLKLEWSLRNASKDATKGQQLL